MLSRVLTTLYTNGNKFILGEMLGNFVWPYYEHDIECAWNTGKT